MALVPAWDKRTGKPLRDLVPDHYFEHPIFGVHLSPTEPASKPVKPANHPKEA